MTGTIWFSIHFIYSLLLFLKKRILFIIVSSLGTSLFLVLFYIYLRNDTDLFVYKSMLNDPYSHYHFAFLLKYYALNMYELGINSWYSMLILNFIFIFILVYFSNRIVKNKNYLIGFIIIFSTSFPYLSLGNALAQGYASILIIVSLFYFINKRFYVSIFIITIAFFIHYSSIIFFISLIIIWFLYSSFLLNNGKINQIIILGILIIVIFTFFDMHSVLRYMSYFSGTTDYSNRTSPYLRILYYALFIIPLFLYHKKIKKDLFLNFASISIMFLFFISLLLTLLGAYELSSRIIFQMLSFFTFFILRLFVLKDNRLVGYYMFLFIFAINVLGLIHDDFIKIIRSIL